MSARPLQFLLLVFAGWVNRRQRETIEFLQEESPTRSCAGTASYHLLVPDGVFAEAGDWRSCDCRCQSARTCSRSSTG